MKESEKQGSVSRVPLNAGLGVTKPHYICASRDGRTNRWRITCPKCGEQFEPLTTRFSTQGLDCPAKKCHAHMLVDYNNETVRL